MNQARRHRSSEPKRTGQGAQQCTSASQQEHRKNAAAKSKATDSSSDRKQLHSQTSSGAVPGQDTETQEGKGLNPKRRAQKQAARRAKQCHEDAWTAGRRQQPLCGSSSGLKQKLLVFPVGRHPKDSAHQTSPGSLSEKPKEGARALAERL